MQRREFLRHCLTTSCGGVLVGTSGCGTILHQERIHQPHSRDIDWKIVALDGLGLALFFVPGVVAFVVDFYSGAIYLPPAGTPGYPVAVADRPAEGADPTTGVPDQWFCQQVPPSELRPRRIEQVVATHLRRPISLVDSGARVSQLADWKQYERQVCKHAEDPQYGVSPRAYVTSGEVG